MHIREGYNAQPGQDPYGRTWSQAWTVYADNHPEVLANYAHQNGRWPNCTCTDCDPVGLVYRSLPGEPVLAKIRTLLDERVQGESIEVSLVRALPPETDQAAVSARQGASGDVPGVQVGPRLRETVRWYQPCGCDSHGDHGGCDARCADLGCAHPLGVEVTVTGSEEDCERRSANPCPATSPENDWPCALEDTGLDHEAGHESASYGVARACWATTEDDLRRWVNH